MHLLLRILITASLVILGCWTVYYNAPLRSIRYDRYTFSDEEAQRLKFYPDAQYAYGIQTWLQQQPERAASFFRQAVSSNVLHMDAWLKLAEIEAARGHLEKARKILSFTTDVADLVFRWKWSQMLLARELGMDKDYYRHTNELLARDVLEQDALQLLHTHMGGEASAVMEILEPSHLSAYLDWLMRWGMPEESWQVWQAMTAIAEPEKETALRYAHFLLNHKRITASVAIWQKYTGSSGLTNPGFERDITNRGFDWRHWGEKDGNWELKRVNFETAEGHYALKVTFNGQENIDFQHVYQIFATKPQALYRLTYAWKSKGITTDQGPFVEIFSYDNKELYQAGPMMTGTQGWREAFIEFVMPEDCHAAVVRLRRKHSMRFDSKIKGRVWIDNFQLERVEDLGEKS